jgi:hypothetical protein
VVDTGAKRGIPGGEGQQMNGNRPWTTVCVATPDKLLDR